MESGIDIEAYDCPFPECDGVFEHLGTHWRYNSEHRPEITDRQHEILTGLLMGDGCVEVNEEKWNPQFCCNMTTRPFLEWLKGELAPLSKDVKFKASAEMLAAESKKRGCVVNEDKYRDQYRLRTFVHPGFEEYRNWSSEGEKKYPEDLKLTPLILKVWFCGDGTSYDNKTKPPSIELSCANEYNRAEFVKSLFGFLDVDPTIRKNIKNDGGLDMKLYFDSKDSEILYDYMEDPLPGFKYKWPERFR